MARFTIRTVAIVTAANAQLLDNLKNLAFPAQPAASPTLDTSRIVAEQQATVAAQQNATTGVQQQEPVSDDPLAEMDLLCLNNTKAQSWFNIQQKLRYILGPPAAVVSLDKTNTLEPALTSIMEDMSVAMSSGEDACGVGKLMVQLLNVITVDSDGKLVGEAVLNNEPLSSPIMTLLLDIPWTAYQPSWPLFGLMAQMSQRRHLAKQNVLEIDGLSHPEMQQFLGAMTMAIGNGDLEALKELSKAFLEAGEGAVEASPIGFVTALLTQAAFVDSAEESQLIFFEAQKIIKRMIYSVQDLDTTLASRWPMWGMAYLASLKAGTV